MPTPKLLDQVRTVIRVKHFSLSTERAYIGWIRRFNVFHHKKPPSDFATIRFIEGQCIAFDRIDVRSCAGSLRD